VVALNPPLNSSKPVNLACTKAVVASVLSLLPEAGVSANANPEAFLATSLLAVGKVVPSAFTIGIAAVPVMVTKVPSPILVTIPAGASM